MGGGQLLSLVVLRLTLILVDSNNDEYIQHNRADKPRYILGLEVAKWRPSEKPSKQIRRQTKVGWGEGLRLISEGHS